MSTFTLRRYRIPLSISSWLTFAISFTFYWITADPGVSYWDCPEYVTVASRLEVGHPPGNPLWMLAMRIATIPFDAANHAYVINICSGLFMAFASFFLCRLIFIPVRSKFGSSIFRQEFSPRSSDILASLIAIGGSLCFSLCDSAWFSAVEAEVYAMSVFLTALSLWIMMLWWYEKSKSKEVRLLVLLAYITGLSLGVHQLNLLLIPVFAIIILYKKYTRKINPAIVLLTCVASIAFIGFILLAFIPGVLFGAQSFELLSVNYWGFPYDSGVLIFLVLLLVLIIISLIFSYHPGSPISKFRTLDQWKSTGGVITFCLAFLFLGLSSFGMIMIRAQASPLMNEGGPSDIFSLSSYILREQYPSPPLIYGMTPYSRPMFEEKIVNGKPDYSRFLLKKEKGIYQPVMNGASLGYRSGMMSREDSAKNRRILENGKGYLLSDYRFSQMLTPELDMWFPRMTSRNINDRPAYQDWGGMVEDEMVRIPVSETIDSLGKFQPRMDLWSHRPLVYSYRPTYYQNLRYFVSYQAYYMYFRYLFWNFIGRQNDYHSNGEIEHGNFITGIDPIDNLLIGDTQSLPSEIWDLNKGRNRYFGIPFALGLLGILWLLFGKRKDRRIFTLVFILFLMTGLAIVVYLNQSPGEPRERDYTFLGSYMAFAMWISAGMTWLTLLIGRIKFKMAVFPLCLLVTLGPPALMAAENFDDHDRRYRFEPTFYASSLLDFEIPAIIFSHGDNSSFPLWYATEVLGKGENHIPVDITYLSLPSYVENLKRQGKKGVSTIAETPQIIFGKFLLTRIPSDQTSQPVKIKDALKNLYHSEKPTPEWPSSKIIIDDHEGKERIINLHDFTKGSSFLSFRHLMLLDLIASQQPDDKVLFFPSSIEHRFYQPLDSLLKPALFGKIYSQGMTDSTAIHLLKKSVDRELKKLDEQNIRPHYIDPVIADRSVRYRGELIIAANELLKEGNVDYPARIVESIEKHYPYTTILPGTFTMADSTFYEGKEFLKLMSRLNDVTSSDRYTNSIEKLDSIMNKRYQEWIKYYYSLSPAQRKTLSNRSKRLLLPQSH